MMRKRYPTDLTDEQWNELECEIPACRPGGRPEKHPRRELFDAMLYQTKTGTQWRLLPHDFPPWKTVYHYFRLWSRNGIFKRMHDHLH
jgi:transposase